MPGFGAPQDIGSAADDSFQGAWNANTNTPTLADGVGQTGDYYRVNVTGSTNLDGITDWVADDLVWFDGTVWAAWPGWRRYSSSEPWWRPGSTPPPILAMDWHASRRLVHAHRPMFSS